MELEPLLQFGVCEPYCMFFFFFSRCNSEKKETIVSYPEGRLGTETAKKGKLACAPRRAGFPFWTFTLAGQMITGGRKPSDCMAATITVRCRRTTTV